MIIPSQDYYSRSEVSNSDLTSLKNLLHPRMMFGDREAIFRFGSLVDCLITEPNRANFYTRTIADDPMPYTAEEWEHATDMRNALYAEAARDAFLRKILDTASGQTAMANQAQTFDYCGFTFQLPTRCKWDWWLSYCDFGGDLKTTFATSQAEFEEALDFFDWDRSRAWYMDLAGSSRDFIYAISKKTGQVFKHFIRRGDPTYERGREKYLELAFQYWCLNLTAA